jgi:hypothetical protein
MTILWEFDEKHPKQVSAYGAAPRLFRPMYAAANEGHPSRKVGLAAADHRPALSTR